MNPKSRTEKERLRKWLRDTPPCANCGVRKPLKEEIGKWRFCDSYCRDDYTTRKLMDYIVVAIPLVLAGEIFERATRPLRKRSKP